MATCMRYTRLNVYWAPCAAAIPHAPSFRLTAGDVIANVHLAKDMTEGATFARRLEVVEVGIGQDGDSKTTCVIVFVENGAVDNAAKIKAKSKKAGAAGRHSAQGHQAVIADLGKVPPMRCVTKASAGSMPIDWVAAGREADTAEQAEALRTGLEDKEPNFRHLSSRFIISFS
jgi:hypothetical protein